MKDGKAVASRPLASHPVNRGKLCPKGLSEHYTIDGGKPREVSAAAQERQAGARQLGRSAGDHGRALRAIQAKYGPKRWAS